MGLGSQNAESPWRCSGLQPLPSVRAVKFSLAMTVWPATQAQPPEGQALNASLLGKELLFIFFNKKKISEAHLKLYSMPSFLVWRVKFLLRSRREIFTSCISLKTRLVRLSKPPRHTKKNNSHCSSKEWGEKQHKNTVSRIRCLHLSPTSCYSPSAWP